MRLRTGLPSRSPGVNRHPSTACRACSANGSSPSFTTALDRAPSFSIVSSRTTTASPRPPSGYGTSVVPCTAGGVSAGARAASSAGAAGAAPGAATGADAGSDAYAVPGACGGSGEGFAWANAVLNHAIEAPTRAPAAPRLPLAHGGFEPAALSSVITPIHAGPRFPSFVHPSSGEPPRFEFAGKPIKRCPSSQLPRRARGCQQGRLRFRPTSTPSSAGGTGVAGRAPR